jgi:hypothetical protein
MEYINHYTLGSFTVDHNGKSIQISDRDSLVSFIKSLENVRFEVFYIPLGYEHRPDLISNKFYNTVSKDWLIMMFNNVSDSFQELNVGDRLLIPII